MQEKLGFINQGEKASMYISDFIKFEEKLGVLNMNTENNDKELKLIFEKQKKQCLKTKIQVTDKNIDIFKKYESTARTLVRGAWFFDYIGPLFEWYVNDRNVDLSTVAREVYTQNLAFRHPWIIRTPARWAMGLINKRDQFNKLFCDEATLVLNRPYDIEELYQDIKQMAMYI